MFERINPWLRRRLPGMERKAGRRQSPRRPGRCLPALEALEDRSLMSAGYVQTNLVSDIAGLAGTTDAALKNPWGMASSSQGAFWLADNATGLSTLYNGQGRPQPPGTTPPTAPLQVTIPSVTNGVPGSATGVVFNGAGGFNVSENGGTPGSSLFLFATQDGLIAGWNFGVDPTHAIIAVNNHATGASYTGLAIGTNGGQTLLYAANFTGVSIDVFNSSFQSVTLSNTAFKDPSLPPGYWPFNIQELNNKLYVTYALPDNGNPSEGLHQAHAGIVDVYSNAGVLLTPHHLIGNGPTGPLNAPWGLAMAPANFGRFSNDLLVGNFGDGHINAFTQGGMFVGPLTLANGQVFQEDDLWALQFGNGPANGPANTLFFTAGLNGETDGLFGSLQAPPPIAAGAALLPKLPTAATQTFATNAANGDSNPYGLAFVPKGYTGGGLLQAGDLLVSNFNSTSGLQGTGSTIQIIKPDGEITNFFTGPTGLGLTTALGVLKSGFVLVGAVPNDGNGNALPGSLMILDSNGHLVRTLTGSPLLDGPWDLTVNDHGSSAQVFAANVLQGTVTRINLSILNNTPLIDSETEIAAGYTHGQDPTAFVLGPTGLAFDPNSGTLFVASTADNEIFAIANANTSTGGHTKGRLVVQDPTHLHGPLGLVLAPNGDIIVANGDAVNPGGTSNDLVEYTRGGHFVGDFQIDAGPATGAAFGLAISTDNNVLRFAAVDDNPDSTRGGSNTVKLFTLGLSI